MIFNVNRNVYSKIADESRRALIEQVKRLSREERVRTFIRHSKLVTELYNAARKRRLALRSGG